MAHKKAGGSTTNVHDSPGQRLGIKLYGGEKASAGNIIIRQKGTKFFAGKGVSMGKDYTLFALKEGKVKMSTKRKVHFDGSIIKKKIAHVV